MMNTVFISDPLVKVKADILSAVHYTKVGHTDLAHAALNRIERRLPTLDPAQRYDVMARLDDAGLLNWEAAA